MSHFVECQTEFRDPQALLTALIECGFEKAQIEIHDQAVPLYGCQRTSENYVMPEQDDCPVHGIDSWTVTIHRAGP